MLSGCAHVDSLPTVFSLGTGTLIHLLVDLLRERKRRIVGIGRSTDAHLHLSDEIEWILSLCSHHQPRITVRRVNATKRPFLTLATMKSAKLSNESNRKYNVNILAFFTVFANVFLFVLFGHTPAVAICAFVNLIMAPVVIGDVYRENTAGMKLYVLILLSLTCVPLVCPVGRLFGLLVIGLTISTHCISIMWKLSQSVSL